MKNRKLSVKYTLILLLYCLVTTLFAGNAYQIIRRGDGYEINTYDPTTGRGYIRDERLMEKSRQMIKEYMIDVKLQELLNSNPIYMSNLFKIQQLQSAITNYQNKIRSDTLSIQLLKLNGKPTEEKEAELVQTKNTVLLGQQRLKEYQDKNKLIADSWKPIATSNYLSQVESGKIRTIR